jgi:periplasmic copper chaperone A
MTAWFLKSIVAVCVLGTLACAGAANAHDYRIGSLRIDHPWATATPQGAQVGAGYLKITNEGTQPDRLVTMTSAAARKVAAHASVKEGDVIKMRPLDKGVEIKPGETVELNPEGMHIMFEGLNAPLVAGERVKATLVFEKAGSIDVEYAVEPLGTKAPAPAPSAQSHTH